MSDFIELLDEDETFEWRPTGPNGEVSESVLVLRRLTQQEIVDLQKRFKPTGKWVRGVWRDDPNDAIDKQTALAVESLDLCLVDWRDVYIRRNGQREPAPCERAYKLKLPEAWKAEIIAQAGGNLTLSRDEGPRSGSSSTGSLTAVTPPAAAKRRQRA